MSEVHVLNPQTTRLENCSLWLSRIDRGLSNAEHQAYLAFMQDEENRLEMLELAALWDKMDALQQLSEVCPHEPAKPEKSRHGWVAAAAVFVAAIVFASVWQSEREIPVVEVAQVIESRNHYTTAVGEQRSIALPDTSELVLNTGSEVRVTYTDKQRLFELVKGEMHITVAHNPEIPLTVYAGDKIIQAVGTAFNVQLNDTDVELLVTDGKVLVAENDESRAAPLRVEDVYLPVSSLALVKGERIAMNQLRSTRAAVETLPSADISADLSWQTGNLVFRGESLVDAMEEVSRYTHLRFDLSDPALNDLQIAGLFQTNDIEGLLAALEQNFAVSHSQISPDTIKLQKMEQQ